MEYGPALKQRVLDLYDQGYPTAKIAERLSVSKSWCRRVKQFRGKQRARPGGSRPKLDQAARVRLAQWISQQPDATLGELRARVLSDLNIEISIGALWNCLRAMQFTLKKKR
jgi:transposase